MPEEDPTRSTGAGVPVLLLALVVALFRQGGLASGGDVLLMVGVPVAAGLTLARGSSPRPRAPALRVAALAFAALVIWMIADGAWHATPGRAIPWAATAAGVALVLWTVSGLTWQDRVVLRDGLLVVGVLLAAATWGGAVLRLPEWSANSRGLWRADGPLTYANATAAALVMLTLVAIAAVPEDGDRSAREDDSAAWPASAAVAAGVLLVVACAATLSRGGALALAIGAVVTAWLTDRHGRRVLFAVLTGGAIAAAGLLPGLPASSARHPLPAVAALLAGMVVAVALARRAPASATATRRRLGPAARSAIVVGSVVVTAAAVATVVTSGVLASRLTLSSSYRVPAAAAALRAWAADPLTGVGPARSSVTWRGGDGASRTLAYLHDEYLQVLFQFGLPALVLLLAAMVALAVAVRGGRPAQHTGPRRRLWAAAAAAFAAFAVHSGLDFLAHLPALPLLCAAAIGLGLPAVASSANHLPAPPGAARHPQREAVTP